ncbi:MAG: hypothetical protein ACK5S5_08475 [Planctomycetota bacterium]
MRLRSVLALAIAVASSACALAPRELNLTPIWFHRLDDDGRMLEWDAAWPLLHYERTPAGGDDLRIRPFWRRVTEPDVEDAVEHQFLWPFGRVRKYPDETVARLWPLWSWRGRPNEEGTYDVDWYALFPLLWGGDSADDREDYFAFLPFYADIPDFLTYDRFQTFLFPLWVGLDKGGHSHDLFFWPLVGASHCAEGGHRWFRVLPLYGLDVEPGRHDRRSFLWPFFSWSTENEDGDSGPVRSFLFWPFFGWRTGPSVSGWTALWPLFAYTKKQDHFETVTVLWPFFKYHRDRTGDDLTQWWLWPFVGRVTSKDQRAWTFAWPIVWWREYDDPDVYVDQQWIVPFFARVVQQAKAGEREDHVKLWPLFHHTQRRDRNGGHVGGEWSALSIWPWRDGNATGFQEAWGWLFELVRGVRRGIDDRAVDVLGRVFTRRERKGATTASVPFLGSYEQDRTGARTLRLFQFLPIPLGGGDDATAGGDDARAEPKR